MTITQIQDDSFLAPPPKKVVILPNVRKSGYGRNGYPEEFKIRALVLLKENDYQLIFTANQIGVSEKTLASWRDKLGVSVFRESDKQTQVTAKQQLAVAVAEAKADLGALTSQIFENASRAEIELIIRIRQVAKVSNNLDHLGRCLKVVHDIVAGKDESIQPSVSQQSNSYYQLVMSQIIRVQEDLQWKINLEQEQLNQSKSLPPLPSQE